MHKFFQPDFKFTGKLTILLAFSFFAAGCHSRNEPVPVPKATVKKETAIQVSENPLSNIAKNKVKTSAETDKENEQNRPVSFPHYKSANNDTAAQRDPFALPDKLQNHQELSKYNRKGSGNAAPFTDPVTTNHAVTNRNNQQTKQQIAPKVTAIQPVVPQYSPEPCVAGIFDNGKEKFVLVRWQLVQGVFRCGEHLGNGYYVKEITTDTVLLSPDQNLNRADTVKLTLR